MTATMNGCEIVWPSAIGSARSAYAPAWLVGSDEEVPRDASHRVEHAPIVNAAPLELVGHHALPFAGPAVLVCSVSTLIHMR